MSKRKVENLLSVPDFAVIETIRGDGDVVVEMIPSIWFKPLKNKPIIARESAKCYYPRRMNNQNNEQYLKHLKIAKFECLRPKNDKKWDLIECRALKVGIGK